MSPAIFILAGAIVVVGVVLRLLHRPELPAPDETGEGTSTEPQADGHLDECCGQHEVCERDSLIAGVGDEQLYFDDEELDAYRGRRADEYTEEETEQFRDVLMTLQPDDVAPWGRSITLRGIELPIAVRDELLMMVDEMRRSRPTTPPAL